MGRRRDLSAEEKSKIINLLASNRKSLDIAKEIERDHRTIKRFLGNSNVRRQRSDKGKIRKITGWQMMRIKRAAVKNPLSSSKQIFERAGVSEIPRTSRCRHLQTIAKMTKPAIRPPLTTRHKTKRLEWARKYIKTDFQSVLFTDECRATLDGPDGWSRGWLERGWDTPIRLRRQQGGGGIMFWGGIIGNKFVGPFRVPKGVKMNAQEYVAFLKTHFVPWFRRKGVAFKKKR